jgi:hypothetical protein
MGLAPDASLILIPLVFYVVPSEVLLLSKSLVLGPSRSTKIYQMAFYIKFKGTSYLLISLFIPAPIPTQWSRAAYASRQ